MLHILTLPFDPARQGFERRFIGQSYACRKGKGTLRALRLARRWAREYRYYLKTDVADYFASVDHSTLLSLLG